MRQGNDMAKTTSTSVPTSMESRSGQGSLLDDSGRVIPMVVTGKGRVT